MRELKPSQTTLENMAQDVAPSRVRELKPNEDLEVSYDLVAPSRVRELKLFP